MSATADIIVTNAFTLTTPPPQLDLTNQFIGDLKSAKDPNFNLAGTNLEKTVAEKVCECVGMCVSVCAPVLADQCVRGGGVIIYLKSFGTIFCTYSWYESSH